MKSVLHFWMLLILPLCLGAQELGPLFEDLADSDYQIREQAHRTLLTYIPQSHAELEKKALACYQDDDEDPEKRARSLKLLEAVAKAKHFEEKDGFIGIQIGAGGMMHENKFLRTVRVGTVMEDMQGAEAGLEQGDQIMEIDGKPFETAEVTGEFMKRIGNSVPGQKIQLKIYRSGKTVDIPVKLMKRPDNVQKGLYDAEKDFSGFFKTWMQKAQASK